MPLPMHPFPGAAADFLYVGSYLHRTLADTISQFLVLAWPFIYHDIS